MPTFNIKHLMVLLVLMAIVSLLEVPTFAKKLENKTNKKWVTIRVTASAFCGCGHCCGRYSNHLLERRYPKNGLAVDPRLIPLTSRCAIGNKYYIAFTTGGDIKGRRIDMFFKRLPNEKSWRGAHARARAFGVKHLTIRVERP